MARAQKNRANTTISPWRLRVVRAVFLAVLAGLAGKLFLLQIVNMSFLQEKASQRHVRYVSVPAHRGMILDRRGEPLAISTPVPSIFANPRMMDSNDPKLKQLAYLLKLDYKATQRKIKARSSSSFLYLKRRVMPDIAKQVMALDIKGVSLQREYKRYYPTGEVVSHLIGFTNVDDVGQEGLELTFDDRLQGELGKKRMIRDRKGAFIEGGETIKVDRPGENLNLSLDLRIQYLAYQSLKAAVEKHKARSGSAVVLDVRTGEVLAMVNQPSFNPNNRRGVKLDVFRNRAVTNLYEPGSTVKPFTVTAALDSGKFTTETIIDTSPGSFQVAKGFTVKDTHDYGAVNLATLIQKSSNVGASKIAMELAPEELWNVFSKFGLGHKTDGNFPGEATGRLPNQKTWRKLERASLSYGYALTLTPLQLARAYMVIANDGKLQPVRFMKSDNVPVGKQVFEPELMTTIREMMEGVVQAGGTATRAAVPFYSVAGKTGTAKRHIASGYQDGHYIASFAGMIPAKDPRLVMVVMIDDPRGGTYFGGTVAAPVFSEVMTGAMRLLNIAPDAVPEPVMQVAAQ